MSIRIQEQDFNHAEEYQKLYSDAPRIGAIVTFCGLVRDFDNGLGNSLCLEHFPQMTEKSLATIVDQAKDRWPIINTRIIHRVGQLSLGDQIVFVGVNSEHRKAAFAACEFIMDYLKTDVPIWKKAITSKKEYWVEAKETDRIEKDKWSR